MFHFEGQLGLRDQKQLVWEGQGICQPSGSCLRDKS
jgi:hypothetical protein